MKPLLQLTVAPLCETLQAPFCAGSPGPGWHSHHLIPLWMLRSPGADVPALGLSPHGVRRRVRTGSCKAWGWSREPGKSRTLKSHISVIQIFILGPACSSPRFTPGGHCGFGTGILAKVALAVEPTLPMPFSLHQAAFLPTVSVVFMDIAQGTCSAPGSSTAQGAMSSEVLGVWSPPS